MVEQLQCIAAVYKRDTYRVCRDGKRKFRMHYSKCRCSRRAVTESQLCKQHGAIRPVECFCTQESGPANPDLQINNVSQNDRL